MNLCAELFDALEELDVRTAPLGLYACEEYQAGEKPLPRLHHVWFLGLWPHLEQMGCTGMSPEYDPRRDRYSGGAWNRKKFTPFSYGGAEPVGALSFTLPDGVGVRLGMAQTSKVKVRKFGSVYRVDPQTQFRARWQELEVAREIRELWRPSYLTDHRNSLSGYLLIAFDQKPEPLEEELAELEVELAWDEHGVRYETRIWPDRYQRQFSVRLCCWVQSTTPAEQGW